MVPGCTEDLTAHSFYNKRYKICPEHQIRNVIQVGDLKMRFCQQCAKLQLVDEFDGAKRSCREKLRRHRIRRRLMKQAPADTSDAPPPPSMAPATATTAATTSATRAATATRPGAAAVSDLSQTRCQVPNCTTDPAKLRPYNQHYRVTKTRPLHIFCRQR